MKDELGDRMKKNYEDRFKTSLMRRTYTVIRIDGKAFHTYTKGLNRPFDNGLIEDMDATTRYLCENIQGAKLGYVQSDEISILITDFDTLTTQAWFDNEVQKMVSVGASLATAKFNQLRIPRQLEKAWGKEIPDGYIPENFGKLAHFDARVFQLPTYDEVRNYFIWRQKDATRNSVSSVAQSKFSQKELHGKSTTQLKEMLADIGEPWEDYTEGQKMGRIAVKETYKVPVQEGWKDYGVNDHVERTRWVSKNAPSFMAYTIPVTPNEY